jgi:glycine cleavage system regulatory protein
MAAMGGRFTIISLFSCPGEHVETIRQELDDLRKLGFEVSLHEADDPGAVSVKAGLPLKLEVVSMDHPGIVQKVVSVLHQHNVNIESLDTKVTSAPLSGTPLFDLILEAAVPAEESIATLKGELQALAAEMNLDVNFLK